MRATEGQGNVTASALLNRGFRSRALTRNVRSTAASRLFGKGVEVVKRDLSDQSSLISALQGVNAAYFMTDSCTGIKREMAQANNFAGALEEVGVEPVVPPPLTALSVSQASVEFLIET